MFNFLTQKLFPLFKFGSGGGKDQRFIAKIKPVIEQINALEKDLRSLSDDELRANTALFRQQLSDGKSLDSILPHAFATVREAALRVRGMRHFDVQLIGGIVIHQGKIAEMGTGEGKTLVATLPSYLNALSGKGVHVVTVNDYLAKRDAEWMGAIYEFLGLKVGYIIGGMPDYARREAYEADITYCVNNELGFDYLRDNLKYRLEERVQRGMYYAIVDEIDSVLIDEARTPLIISGRATGDPEMHAKVDKLIRKLSEGDYEIDEKLKTALLTEAGIAKIEELARESGTINSDSALYDLENIAVVHYVDQALRANRLFKKDVDYIVRDGKVYIIDEFTGRIMEGRRYSDGLHEAIEAKEGMKIQGAASTIASVTFQNLFRGYERLGGMTGTAKSDAVEFSSTYGLSIVSVPTHMPIARKDHDDVVYRTVREKHNAIIEAVETAHAQKQPVLIGTVNIKQSEQISQLLKKHGLKHNVLNAKFHEKEAMIIAQAGHPGAITVATNMAGRGTDIMLGGNAEMLVAEKVRKLGGKLGEDTYAKLLEETKQQVAKDREVVLQAGGLYVIGTERHESRRIDNQLRGRSGRQGDIGKTKFFLSLEDDLMRIFGSEKISSLLLTLGLKEGEAIAHPWVSKAVEKAQHKVEQRNYEVRKNLLQFDDVMNDQRQVVYGKRLEILQDSSGLLSRATDMANAVVQRLVARLIEDGSPRDDWDIHNLNLEITRIFGSHLDAGNNVPETKDERGWLINWISDRVQEHINDKFAKHESCDTILRQVFLVTIDQLWQDHLLSLDRMRTGINLRAYAQKDPLNEYKREAYHLFKMMLEVIEEEIVKTLSHMQWSENSNRAKNTHEEVAPHSVVHDIDGTHGREYSHDGVQIVEGTESVYSDGIGSAVKRNELCPCGSGLKYKRCHGKIA